MSDDPPDALTAEESAYYGALGVASELAHRCREIRGMEFSVSERILEDVVNSLMTDFWDQNFSQTEIRQAFLAALADMNRYAAGHERRSDEGASSQAGLAKGRRLN
jgi:hypothetical protein